MTGEDYEARKDEHRPDWPGYMTDHLPECGRYCDGKPPKCRGGDCTLCDEVDCICTALRACEQRVRTAMHTAEREEYLNGLYEGRNEGYAAGLAAAHDAVAGLPGTGTAVPGEGKVLGRADALAAIDALTDGGCRTPDDPCADPDACDSLTCARERLHLTLRDEADALAAIDGLKGEQA